MGGTPRQQLGIELRKLRRHAKLSGTDLADLLGVSQSKVSRTEVGSHRTEIDMVEAWLDAVAAAGAPVDEATRARILKLADDALVDISSYRTMFRGSLAKVQRERIKQDAAARRIRHFQPAMIPGPLQTAAYARAALLAARVADETDLDEAVEARLERGRRLQTAGAPRYEVIMTELALRWRPVEVSVDERSEAWQHLLAIKAGTVVIRVVPADKPTRRAPMCAFMITEFARPDLPTVVQVELPAVEVAFSHPIDVAEYERVWAEMDAAALSAQQSAKLIRQMLREQ